MIRTIRNHTLESRKGIIWEFPGSPLVRIWSVAQSSIPESTVRELGSCKQQGKKKRKKKERDNLYISYTANPQETSK